MLQALLFIATLVFGLVLTFIVSPAFSFVLYEAIYFFSPAERWWSSYFPSISYSFFSVVFMLSALLVSGRFRSEANNPLSTPQFRWLYALIVMYGIAAFYAVNPEGHQEALVNYVKLAIIMTIAYKLVETRSDLDYAIWGYVFGSFYISFLIYQTGRNWYDRVEGVGTVDSPDANGIAAAIAPSLVVCLYYFWTRDNKVAKALFALAGVFIANAIILLNSRGAFLGIAMSILFFMYYVFFSSLRRKFQRATAIGISIAGIMGSFYLADDAFFSRLETMTQTELNSEQETGSTRFLFWASALDIAKDHPFGAGFRGFDSYAPFYLPEDLTVSQKVYAVSAYGTDVGLV